jgi:hypothetical protein
MKCPIHNINMELLRSIGTSEYWLCPDNDKKYPQAHIVMTATWITGISYYLPKWELEKKDNAGIEHERMIKMITKDKEVK